MTMIIDYTAEELVLRAVRYHVNARRKRDPPPAWSVLKRPFCIGSTRAAELCLAANLDPDTGEPLGPKEDISCGRARKAETPWWEPRPWGESGPPIDPHVPGFADAFNETWVSIYAYRGAWRYVESGELVTNATHWRPKGPAPEVTP